MFMQFKSGLLKAVLASVVFLTGISAAFALPTVYIAGDSTVMTYKAGYNYYPQQGWGGRIAEFFNTKILFANKAIGGRSAKSFVDEGRLAEILKVIKPGDFLFVQFGHNDALPAATYPLRHTDPQTTYKAYLRQFIDGAKAKGQRRHPYPRHADGPPQL